MSNPKEEYARGGVGNGDSQRGRWAAAGVMLLTMPIALGVMQVLAQEENTSGALFQVISEGGPWAYAVLGAGILASIASAVSMTFAPRGWALALVSFALPFIVALEGTGLSVDALLSTVPDRDRAVIVMMSTGEIASLEFLAVVIGAVGCGLIAISAVVTSRRFVALTTTTTSFLLAGSLIARAEFVNGYQRALSSISHTSPAPYSTRVLWHGADAEAWWIIATALTFAATFCAVLAAAIRRRQLVRNRAVLLTLLLTPAAVTGLTVLWENVLVRALQSARPQPRLSLDGFSSRSDLAWFHAEGREARPPEQGQPLCLALETNVERADLLRGMHRAQAMQAPVSLCGVARVRSSVPRLFLAVAEAASDDWREVPLLVLAPEEACARCVGEASLTGAGLRVSNGSASWELIPGDRDEPKSPLPALMFEWATTPADLARAAEIAFSHGHVLAVRIE